jgi:hypothetical protein
MTQPSVTESSSESATATSTESLVEILPSRYPEGQGLSFKVRSNGRIFRLDSAREPHAPRFWCFRVVRCSTAGIVDISERPWYGGDRMNREELPAAIAAIRAAPDEWLALPQHADLKNWVVQALPVVQEEVLLPKTSRATRSE